MEITELALDQHYSNLDIYKSLSIQNIGGVRPKIVEGTVQFIVVTTSSQEVNISFARNPYADRIEGNMLIYTAAGLAGDQSLTGVNKRIVEQYDKPFPIFGFVNEGSAKGRKFIGLLELVRHYQETQIDGKRNLRQAWIFEFRVHRNFKLAPLALAYQMSEAIIRESREQLRDEEYGEVKLAEPERLNARETRAQQPDYASLEAVRSKLLTVNPYSFEVLIKDTIERNGFYNVSVTKRSGDGGIDINGYLDVSHYFIHDTLVQFQAKRWKHSVGRKEVAEFRGSLRSPLGVIVTTSHFTSNAQQESQMNGQKPIMLVDGIRLSEIVTDLQVPFEKYLPAS